ncbi:MAG: AEC family transporter [Rhizobiales bacterium]|nr:AEC family transporter [Hyphomicrobiales bacterium]
MAAILITILPVFGLIAIGFVSAKTRFIGTSATQGMSLFVFNLALPALLFRTMILMEQQGAELVPLWIAYFGGLILVWFAASIAARFVPALHGGGAAAAMSSTFGNVVMLGLPLTLSHFGEAGAVPASFIVSVHAPLLWLVATLHFETARQGKAPSIMRLLAQLAREFTRNPIVLALILGSAWRATGIGLHPVIDRTLELLAGAGVPAALVALGLSLAGYSLKGQANAIVVLIILKMILLPIVIWIFAAKIVGIPPLWVEVAVLIAAMPTGANAYLFAQRYETAIPAVSGAIAVGTAFALFTSAVLLWLMGAGYI